MKGRRGFSLVDLLLTMVIIAFVLIPMTGLFPMGHRAVQKGRNIAVASGLAEAQVNQIRMQFPTQLSGAAPILSSTVQTVDTVDYRISTQIWPVAFRNQLMPGGASAPVCYLADVLVDVSYPDGLPFEYATRISLDSQAMQSQWRRGFTLVELLVASVVGVLLLGAVAMFAILGLRLWHSGADKVDVDESALVALHAFETALSESDVGSVYLNPSGVDSGISFLSGYDGSGNLQYVVTNPASSPNTRMADDGRILWQSRQILYYDSAHLALKLGTVPLTPTMQPTPYRLDTWSPTPQDRLVAANIEQVTISDAPFDVAGHTLNPTPSQNPIYVKITAGKPGVTYVTTLSTAVVMDNGIVGGTKSAP